MVCPDPDVQGGWTINLSNKQISLLRNKEILQLQIKTINLPRNFAWKWSWNISESIRKKRFDNKIPPLKLKRYSHSVSKPSSDRLQGEGDRDIYASLQLLIECIIFPHLDSE